jgi:threonyl-tRNA synthetase
MWLPKGTVVREQIEKLAKETEERYGYVRVVTPHIAREELFLTSGHLPYYKDSMYPPMVMDDGTYYLKAMNCPHHHRIYLNKPRSYRDLPLRLAEYGTCYRNELSGTLSGLLRVRCMAMNDAHMYCRKDQIKSEFASVLKMTKEYFDIFGLKDYWFRLSKWDSKHTEKYINQPENWEYCEGVLRDVLVEMRLPFKEVSDEAAFYGPKVDVQFKSAIGREETMSTIQLDFAAKGRFGLSYVDAEGKQNGEVFVIHRAPLSVHERFMAFLIEHYAGAFPLWLAPVQVALLPIGEKHVEYAHAVAAQLKKAGIRVEVHAEGKSIGAKIRHATLQKIPYMAIMGDKEVSSESMSVRARDGHDLGSQTAAEFTHKLITDIENHT